MRRARPAPPALLLATLLLLPGAARGWVDEGHEVVGALAELRLGEAARAMVREILGPARLADREVALWADDHRDRSNAPYHWVDIPFEAGRYDAGRDCPGGLCAVARIEWAAEVLTRASDHAARLDALRWLVHLVGDLHQPLHAAEGWRQGNRGGVRLQAHLGHRSYVASLHVLWDAEVLWPVMDGRTPAQVAARVEASLGASRGADWAAERSPATWAGESNRLARAIYQELRVGPAQTGRIEVPEAYVAAQRARVEEALTKAGVRLGALLDRIARQRADGAPVPPDPPPR